ncbi:MAG: hypothetical protein EXS10_07145 [Phycisphaerales bacterium]|nr:hypothetical protein [Phycisphaerales bacterium]
MSKKWIWGLIVPVALMVVSFIAFAVIGASLPKDADGEMIEEGGMHVLFILFGASFLCVGPVWLAIAAVMGLLARRAIAAPVVAAPVPSSPVAAVAARSSPPVTVSAAQYGTIEIHGKTHVGTFVTRIHEECGIHVRVYQGNSKRHAESEVTIHSTRSEDAPKGNSLSLHGNMRVDTVEASVYEQIGIRIQIVDRNGKLMDNSEMLRNIRD